MNFETIVGIEIHVEMKTKSKMFSLAPINFGAAPNSQVVPLDMAFPGTMPRVNKEAVKNAIASNSPQPTTTTIAGGKKIRKINKSKAHSEETPSKKEAVAKKKSASQSTTKENE